MSQLPNLSTVTQLLFRIMPPGTWHMVYTPIRTLALGGHFYTYETLHLTEMSRAFDRLHCREVTNTTHVSSYPTLCTMMVYTLRSDSKGLLYSPLLSNRFLIIIFQHFT